MPETYHRKIVVDDNIATLLYQPLSDRQGQLHRLLGSLTAISQGRPPLDAVTYTDYPQPAEPDQEILFFDFPLWWEIRLLQALCVYSAVDTKEMMERDSILSDELLVESSVLKTRQKCFFEAVEGVEDIINQLRNPPLIQLP
ncbi:MAG TPA: hypothetical protein VD999_03130 [Vitreimonas sp.]|nr:hypothetical protein [Vitreimonas sp.]